MSRHIMESVRALPHRPGVYLFKDAAGKVLYVGKATDLQKRVSSYFAKTWLAPKLGAMIEKASLVDSVQTPTEVEALLLEAQLVKQLRPRYNTMLRDDKSYPLLKISGGPYPRLFLTRTSGERGAVYYGPFTDAKLLREAIRLMNAIFPLRKCHPLPKKECLYYHLHQCLAPCIKPEVKPAYDAVVREVKAFLGGGKKSLVDYLTQRMDEAARELRFEDAQMFKEQLSALTQLSRRRFDAAKPAGTRIALSGTQQLKRLFHMARSPERIVCFDVSNVAGHLPVASRVSFYRELPDKNEYRRYRIRTVAGIDDYAMICEAVTRMIRALRDGREAFDPDILLIDGGKGHLHAVETAMQAEGYTGPTVLSIAKRFEHLYAAGRREPIILDPESAALRLLVRVRDEAHRFAVTYHRLLRGKALRASLLDQIPGVGEQRKRRLIEHYGSLEAVRDAGPAELARLDGMNPKLAGQIISFLIRRSRREEESQ